MLNQIERPLIFDDMKGQEAIVENVRQQSILNKFFQVYILGGQFGSGKTTLARILSRAINCTNKDDRGNPCLECEHCKSILTGNDPDVIEMDAASNTGVDAIRDLKETVHFMPVAQKKKIYIIDEVHMLSTGAFNALLKVLEEPPEHVVFILCTTELKKIPSTVRSRAAKYQFLQISEDTMFLHLSEVAKKHNISTTEDGLRLICKNSEGAMRNALSLLEQVGQFGKVTEDAVAAMLGVSDPKYLFDLLKHMLKADRVAAIQSVDTLLKNGKEPLLMVSDLMDIVSDCVLASYTGTTHLKGTRAYTEQIEGILSNATSEMLVSLADGLMSLRMDLRQIPGRTTLVCGIIRMLSDNGSAVAVLSARINALEEQMVKGNNFSNSVPNTVTYQEEIGTNTASTSTTEEVNKDLHEVKKTQLPKESLPTSEEVSDATKGLDGTERTEENTEEVLKSPKPAENNISKSALSAFQLFSSFSKSSSSRKKTVSMPKDDVSDKSVDMEEYIDNLCNLDPVLRNILTVACKRENTERGVVFVTKQEPVYRMLTQYEEAKGKFLFEFRLER